MLGLLAFVFSPIFLLVLVGVSYFALLALDFVTYDFIATDLWILGLVTTCLVGLLFPIKKFKINIRESYANRLIKIITLSFSIISIYLLLYFQGEVYQLIDERFSVPGFGPISSLYAVGSVVGFAVFFQAKMSNLRAAFVLLSIFVGFLIGGKGFLIYVAFGVGLSIRSGISPEIKFKQAFIFVALVACSVLVGFSQNNSNDDLLIRLLLRLFYASDSIAWLGQMSPSDISNFEITTNTFLADIVLRFFGMRINQLSVGAEMANVVANVQNGSGPNATLPVLAYLINRGDLVASMLFLTTLFFIISLFLRYSIKMSRRFDAGILFAASIFFSPVFIIDLMVYLQYLFWLLILGLFASIRWGFLLCRRK